MTDEQILNHFYVLGIMAFERGKVKSASDDTNFREFFNVTVNSKSQKMRFDAFDNWYSGYNEAKGKVNNGQLP